MKIINVWIIVLLLLVFSDSKASAYCILGNSNCPQTGTGWPDSTATFYSEGYSGSDSTFDNAFVEALDSWNNLSNFSYSSISSSANPCNGPDSISGWEFSSTICGNAFGSTTLAVTTTWARSFDPALDTIVDADISFNIAKNWDIHSGVGTGGNIDFKRVAVHELGHALGLDHDETYIAIMNATYSETNEEVQADDIDGLIALYGGDSCTYSITPTNQPFNSSGGSDIVSVVATSGCDWTATSNDSWITINSGSSGTGNGTVDYSVSTNTSTNIRTATMMIAGETFTVIQSGSDDGGGLSAPTGFSSSVEGCTTSPLGTSCTVSFSWTGVSAATGYKLYYGYSSGIYEAPVDLANVTSVTFSGVPGGTYYLAISAYDSKGNESDKSEEIVLFVGEASVPTNFSATVEECTTSPLGASCTVSFSWTGVSAATGYKLYYGYSSGSYEAPVDLGNVTSVTFSGVPGGTYYLAISAYDSEGIESGYSDELILEVGSNSANMVERNSSPFIR